jgi:membrane associated rhomboid family serine protease
VNYRFYAFWLCGISIVVFLMQLVITGFTDYFLLNEMSFFEPWRFLTSIFLHGGFGHLLYNLFALALFGSILEKLVGGRNFLLVFFSTGLIANLFSINFYSSSLGASGAIFGVIGALIVVRPNLPIFAFGLPMPIFVAGILWGLGDFLGAVAFIAGNPIDNTGNIAHLSGMILGLIMGFFFRERTFNERRFSYRINEEDMRNWEDRYM